MRQLGSILVLGLLILNALAQKKPGESHQLPTGSVLRVTLAESLAVMDSKVGDPVRFHVIGLVSKDAVRPPREPLTLVGHITEVQVRGEGQPESRIGIAFDNIEIQSPEQRHALKLSALVMEIRKVSIPVLTDSPTGVVPTSGDDPVQRASPRIDPGYSRPSLSQPGPRPALGFPKESRVKDFVLHPNESTNSTIISCKTGNIVLSVGALMLVRLTNPVE